MVLSVICLMLLVLSVALGLIIAQQIAIGKDITGYTILFAILGLPGIIIGVCLFLIASLYIMCSVLIVLFLEIVSSLRICSMLHNKLKKPIM